jgi:rRNA small subunit pseudouridine methyltransferase Nep1
MSLDAPTVRISEWVKTLPEEQPIVMAIGAIAHGADNFGDEYVDEKIAISEYPLSAAGTCSKITCAFEDLWDIL